MTKIKPEDEQIIDAESQARAREDEPQAATSESTVHTVADLRKDDNLWYKLLLLNYDLKHLAKDRCCEDRLSRTIDPLYISAPYFSAEETAAIKSALVNEATETSVEQTITKRLENFFEKRRASDDARPCGPHDLVPVFLDCFGVEEEKFVSRVRRSGLGRP